MSKTKWMQLLSLLCLLSLAACSAGTISTAPVAPLPTQLPTETLPPQKSDLQVVMFYSPL